MFDELSFEIAKRKHAREIESFMLSEFGTNEPITRSLGATPVDLCDFFHDLAESGYSNERATPVDLCDFFHDLAESGYSNESYSTIVYDSKRKRGLGKELTRRAIETARCEGCNWVATAATASASQGVFSRVGFQTLYEIPYADFREHGKAVFRNLHDGCRSGKFMALRINLRYGIATRYQGKDIYKLLLSEYVNEPIAQSL
ncbi:unnamed protein product, partial [Strongylus vulgaris]